VDYNTHHTQIFLPADTEAFRAESNSKPYIRSSFRRTSVNADLVTTRRVHGVQEIVAGSRVRTEANEELVSVGTSKAFLKLTRYELARAFARVIPRVIRETFFHSELGLEDVSEVEK
jgi:hypothetical protein